MGNAEGRSYGVCPTQIPANNDELRGDMESVKELIRANGGTVTEPDSNDKNQIYSTIKLPDGWGMFELSEDRKYIVDDRKHPVARISESDVDKYRSFVRGGNLDDGRDVSERLQSELYVRNPAGWIVLDDTSAIVQYHDSAKKLHTQYSKYCRSDRAFWNMAYAEEHRAKMQPQIDAVRAHVTEVELLLQEPYPLSKFYQAALLPYPFTFEELQSGYEQQHKKTCDAAYQFVQWLDAAVIEIRAHQSKEDGEVMQKWLRGKLIDFRIIRTVYQVSMDNLHTIIYAIENVQTAMDLEQPELISLKHVEPAALNPYLSNWSLDNVIARLRMLKNDMGHNFLLLSASYPWHKICPPDHVLHVQNGKRKQVVIEGMKDLVREYHRVHEFCSGCGERFQFYIRPVYDKLEKYVHDHPEHENELKAMMPKFRLASNDGSDGIATGLAKGLSGGFR